MQTRSVLNLALVVVAIGMAPGFRPGSDTSTRQGTVNDARILAEKDTGNNWLVNGRINDSRHFSPLRQINDKNVASLGLAWYLNIEGGMGVVSEPGGKPVAMPIATRTSARFKTERVCIIESRLFERRVTTESFLDPVCHLGRIKAKYVSDAARGKSTQTEALEARKE